MDSSVVRIAACVSLILGAIECFAGFKIMKFTLALSGLIAGVVIGAAVGIFGDSIILGITLIVILGAGLAALAYIFRPAGIFILTSFLTGIAAYVICANYIAAVTLAVTAGVLSVIFVKPVVIISTSFSGAAIILSSAYMMMGLGINPHPVITIILTFFIMVSGAICQFATTKKERITPFSHIRISNTSGEPTFSERKYPGMQRAYRNFCIECGYELAGKSAKCPRCGFSFDD